MSIKEQLYAIMSVEYDNFIAELKTKPPDEILNCAFEKVLKEDILRCFKEEDIIDDTRFINLLEYEHPLDELYHEFLDDYASYVVVPCDY